MTHHYCVYRRNVAGDWWHLEVELVRNGSVWAVVRKALHVPESMRANRWRLLRVTYVGMRHKVLECT